MIDGKTISIRSPKYATADSRCVDCEINHPEYGWVPFTCDPDDVMPYSKDIYDRAVSLNPATYTSPPPTDADYTNAIQIHIDRVAQAKNYSDGVSLASYKDSTNSEWAAEATSFIAWRDAVWAYAYQQLAIVSTGQRAQPTVDALIGELPAPPWTGGI